MTTTTATHLANLRYATYFFSVYIKSMQLLRSNGYTRTLYSIMKAIKKLLGLRDPKNPPERTPEKVKHANFNHHIRLSTTISGMSSNDASSGSIVMSDSTGSFLVVDLPSEDYRRTAYVTDSERPPVFPEEPRSPKPRKSSRRHRRCVDYADIPSAQQISLECPEAFSSFTRNQQISHEPCQALSNLTEFEQVFHESSQAPQLVEDPQSRQISISVTESTVTSLTIAGYPLEKYKPRVLPPSPSRCGHKRESSNVRLRSTMTNGNVRAKIEFFESRNC